MSASICVHEGPARTRVISKTRTPWSGPDAKDDEKPRKLRRNSNPRCTIMAAIHQQILPC